MDEKLTLVLGASPNPQRYSHHAVKMLTDHGFRVFAVGMRTGDISGVVIQKPFPALENIHTVTLYVGPKNQPFYYDYIVKLDPRRVIFNPGTENPELEEMLARRGIEIVKACTLVMIVNREF